MKVSKEFIEFIDRVYGIFIGAMLILLGMLVIFLGGVIGFLLWASVQGRARSLPGGELRLSAAGDTSAIELASYNSWRTRTTSWFGALRHSNTSAVRPTPSTSPNRCGRCMSTTVDSRAISSTPGSTTCGGPHRSSGRIGPAAKSGLQR